MAAILPTVLFPSWSEDGTDITLPLASLPQITASEADASTGNGSEVLRALLDAAYTNYAALSASAKPVNMTITRSNLAGANSQTAITQTYTVSFTLAPTAVNVAAE